MAPTASSILCLSRKSTDSTQSTPATRPRMEAPPALTNAQGQVIATRPASIPLHIIAGSGFLVLSHHIERVAPRAPVADASIVFTATTAIRRSDAACEEPGLKP